VASPTLVAVTARSTATCNPARPIRRRCCQAERRDAGLWLLQAGGDWDYVWNDANANGIQDSDEAGSWGGVDAHRDQRGGVSVTDHHHERRGSTVHRGAGTYTVA